MTRPEKLVSLPNGDSGRNVRGAEITRALELLLECIVHYSKKERRKKRKLERDWKFLARRQFFTSAPNSFEKEKKKKEKRNEVIRRSRGIPTKEKNRRSSLFLSSRVRRNY